MWLMAEQTPHTGTSWEPERLSRAMGGSWGRMLSVLDSDAVQYAAETLDTGFYPGLAEDTVGLFPWRDEWRWDMGMSAGEPI